MVGVPGKSKGCSTCRRRKKGCDQKKPICGQCALSGYVCGGYQRDVSFIIHPASKSAAKAYFVPHTASLALSPSLDRSAIDTQCRALFWDLYLPHGIAEVRDGMLQKCNHPANWTSVLLEMSQEEPSLELAFSALSMSRLGRSKHDMRLVKESTRLYGRALKMLQRALTNTSRMYTEEVLAACSLLGLYEVFENGEDHNKSVGWVSHAQGAARLIELRGPHRHINRQAHHVFLGARLPILYSAILRRKRTFLADCDWQTIPWRAVGGKTYHDILIDNATKIPDVLEKFDMFRASPSRSGANRSLSALLQSCQDLKKTLTEWEHKKKQLSRPVLIKHEQQASGTYPFEYEMSWENHLFLNASLVYWSAQLILSTTIVQIELFLASIGFARPNMCASTTEQQQQARQFAICLAQSVPYALTPDMGALGVVHIAFPVSIAFRHFTESNEEQICAWLIEVCTDLRREGVRVRPFDDPFLSNKLRDTKYPGKPSENNQNDIVTDVALTRAVVPSGSRSDWPLAPSTASNGGIFKPTFIYENPAKYNLDTNSPG